VTAKIKRAPKDSGPFDFAMGKKKAGLKPGLYMRFAL
jgi:hypothetical protein